MFAKKGKGPENHDASAKYSESAESDAIKSPGEKSDSENV
jgi:hypothetical protein